MEGPISFDLATDRQAAQVKGYHSPVAGDADIFLVPSITAGNLLGKALYSMAGERWRGLVLGASVPITVNSRGPLRRRSTTPSPSPRPWPGEDWANTRYRRKIMSHRLLILNPGSTSTKAAVYDGEHQTAMKSIVHTNQDLAPYPSLYDQLDYRVALVQGWLAQEGGPVHPVGGSGPGRHHPQHRGRRLSGG